MKVTAFGRSTNGWSDSLLFTRVHLEVLGTKWKVQIVLSYHFCEGICVNSGQMKFAKSLSKV